MQVPSIPIFRFGTTYHSLDQRPLTSFRGGEAMAQVAQANAGLIRRDLLQLPSRLQRLQRESTAAMLERCARAADLFLEAPLPLANSIEQRPEDFVATLSASCGLPQSLVRANMDKLAFVLRSMPQILAGLTRNLDLRVLDQGVLEHEELLLSYLPATTALGAILPSNSPGVHSLWLPAVALRIPVVLKPGREDPWTPWRLIQALLAAECPPEGFAFYPCGHDGAAEVLNLCHRALLFGDQKTVDRYAHNPGVQVHGPGWSKIVIGEDQADHWPEHVDLIADSIARNGGRSCVNASTVVIPRHARELATALAERLATIQPRPLDHPQASLAAFANPDVATFIDRKIDQQLATPGAEDLTAALRTSPRLTTHDNATFLHPTLVHCSDPEHPLARTEFLLPFAAVVELPQPRITDYLGPTLVCTAITHDPAFRAELLHATHIDRLNLGPIPTPTVSWDQPHEGNLFELLYHRRAIQGASA